MLKHEYACADLSLKLKFISQLFRDISLGTKKAKPKPVYQIEECPFTVNNTPISIKINGKTYKGKDTLITLEFKFSDIQGVKIFSSSQSLYLHEVAGLQEGYRIHNDWVKSQSNKS